MKTEVELFCEQCDTDTLHIIGEESCYSDGADEQHCSNFLCNFKTHHCSICGNEHQD